MKQTRSFSSFQGCGNFQPVLDKSRESPLMYTNRSARNIKHSPKMKVRAKANTEALKKAKVSGKELFDIHRSQKESEMKVCLKSIKFCEMRKMENRVKRLKEEEQRLLDDIEKMKKKTKTIENSRKRHQEELNQLKNYKQIQLQKTQDNHQKFMMDRLERQKRRDQTRNNLKEFNRSRARHTKFLKDSWKDERSKMDEFMKRQKKLMNEKIKYEKFMNKSINDYYKQKQSQIKSESIQSKISQKKKSIEENGIKMKKLEQVELQLIKKLESTLAEKGPVLQKYKDIFQPENKRPKSVNFTSRDIMKQYSVFNDTPSTIHEEGTIL